MSRPAMPKKVSVHHSEPTPFIKKIGIQRILREFPSLFTAIESGAIEADEANNIITSACEDVRSCMLDAIGEVHDDLLDSFAGILVKKRLDGDDIELGRLSQIIKSSFAASKTIWNDQIPSKSFGLSDRASIASTLINTATKLQVLSIKHKIPNIHIAAIEDLISDCALRVSQEILGDKATYKDIYNLAQSCMRNITDVFVESHQLEHGDNYLAKADERVNAIGDNLIIASAKILEQKFSPKPETSEQHPGM